MRYRQPLIQIQTLTLINLTKSFSRPRAIMGYILLFVFIHMNTQEIIPYSEIKLLNFTPYFFPFITSTRIVRLFLYFILLFLLCDLGDNSFSSSVQLRVRGWIIRTANIAATFLKVLMFWVIVNIVPVCLYFSKIEWSSRWGKVWGTLARNEDYEILGEYAIRVSSKILDNYSPLKATMLSFFLCVMSSYILGMLFLLAGRYLNGTIGLLASVGFVLLDFWVETDISALHILLPISFCTYGNLNYLSLGFVSSAIDLYKCIIITITLATVTTLLYIIPFHLCKWRRDKS